MQNKVIILLIIALGFVNVTFGQIELSGVYKGKNLYVQNPFAGDMQHFCTEKVFINNEERMVNVQSSAFEIDLSYLKLNDPIRILIVHSNNCKPKILNPQVIRDESSDFQFVSFTAETNTLNWSTKGEEPGGKLFIQQFVNGKWLTIKEMVSNGAIGLHNYNEKINHHSGLNKYKIKYLDTHGKVVYSRIEEYTSTEEPVTFYPTRVSTSITMSRAVPYEIMDSYGNIVKKGNGDKIDCTELKTGFYYLNMNNQTEKFLKK